MKQPRGDQDTDKDARTTGHDHVPQQPSHFVGRSRGVIHIAEQDLISPLDEDWEVDSDL